MKNARKLLIQDNVSEIDNDSSSVGVFSLELPQESDINDLTSIITKK